MGVYKLDCHACGHTVTVTPCDGERACPLCDAILHVEWNAAWAESELEGKAGGRL